MNAKISARQQQPGHAAAHHQQRHHRAPTVAKDVTKREQQKLAHGFSFRRVLGAVSAGRLRVGNDPPVAQPHDARRVLQQPLVVRGEDKRQPQAPVQLAHQVDQLRRILRVQVRRRLVGQHQRRPVNDGPRHRNPLPLAARKQIGPLPCARRQPHAFQRRR